MSDPIPTNPAVPDVSSDRLVETFLSGKSPRTADGYRSDFRDFCAFLGAPSIEDAARVLLTGGHGPANELVLRYRTSMLAEGLSPATVNRRLSAIKSIVKTARISGLVTWSVEVPGPRQENVGDTRGPGEVGYRAMLAATDDPRDAAILCLLHDLALRREETVRLDLEDVDLLGGTVMVQGKGKLGKTPLTLPAPTRAALEEWIRVRGSKPGPLFCHWRCSLPLARLTGRSLVRIVWAAAERAGLGRVRPHGLRHTGITTALELTNGNVRAVARFGRIRDLKVLVLLDDNRRDLGGDVARLVAERQPGGRP